MMTTSSSNLVSYETAMHPLYSVTEIRAIEQAALSRLPAGTLMQRAGQAAAKMALELLPVAPKYAKILVLAGPGNNGGDALEAASHLAQAGAQVSIVLLAKPERQSADARQALARAKSSRARFLDPALVADSATDAMSSLGATRWMLVIDGLFGIGLARALGDDVRTLVDTINRLRCPVLALDVPSGLDADTGAIVGGDAGVALQASNTMTFIGDKPGLHTGHGRDVAGKVQVARLDIGLQDFPPAHACLNEAELFRGSLRRRPHASHKGSFGDVAILGGAQGMAGAPLLAARAAARCGAGRVYALFVDAAPAYDSGQPELMCRPARDFDLSSSIVVAGPGLGTSAAAHELLLRVLEVAKPVVLDADALNLLTAESGLQQQVAQRSGATLITPHPLEAARLLGISNAKVQANRPEAARSLARLLNAIVILKGSGSIIAEPDGHIVINPTGNPGLASAGTGDVLAGICGALLAQGWPPAEAARGAVWLHGRAADMLVEQGIGPVGLAASELLPVARSALNRLIDEYA
jgi:ADP-dependent NAD(P)H-hydrate dehydratase / NAD(P)H-hydrate epimerase